MFMFRITNLRSPCRAQRATWSRMRVYASSWEHGWRYSTSLMSLCVDTIVSSFVLMITFLSFTCMFAIGQIAKQLIFVRITYHESLPVCRNMRSFKHALSLHSATVRSTIDCLRLFVRYLSQTISTLLTGSS